MEKRILGSLMALLAISVFAKPIDIYVSPTFPPEAFLENGILKGCQIEFIKRFAKEHGYEPVIHLVSEFKDSWPPCEQPADRPRICMGGITPLVQRLPVTHWSKPYFYVLRSLVARGLPLPAELQAELKNDRDYQAALAKLTALTRERTPNVTVNPYYLMLAYSKRDLPDPITLHGIENSTAAIDIQAQLLSPDAKVLNNNFAAFQALESLAVKPRRTIIFNGVTDFDFKNHLQAGHGMLDGSLTSIEISKKFSGTQMVTSNPYLGTPEALTFASPNKEVLDSLNRFIEKSLYPKTSESPFYVFDDKRPIDATGKTVTQFPSSETTSAVNDKYLSICESKASDPSVPNKARVAPAIEAEH